MCILKSLTTSASQVADSQCTEQNYRDTAGTHTFSDAQRKIKNKPRMPADEYETLKKNITTYAMYLLTLFGDQYQHYQGVWAIHRMLHHHEGNTAYFSAKYSRK